MKFSFLKQIVTEEAYQRKENAGYAGAWNDGGCQSLLSKLEDYFQNSRFKTSIFRWKYLSL